VYSMTFEFYEALYDFVRGSQDRDAVLLNKPSSCAVCGPE
jgi:hypothetical protein